MTQEKMLDELKRVRSALELARKEVSEAILEVERVLNQCVDVKADKEL